MSTTAEARSFRNTVAVLKAIVQQRTSETVETDEGRGKKSPRAGRLGRNAPEEYLEQEALALFYEQLYKQNSSMIQRNTERHLNNRFHLGVCKNEGTSKTGR